MNHRHWILSPEWCSVYMGIESFTSTATIYLIIALNLHTISTYNLAIKTIQREEKLNDDQQRHISIYSQQAPNDVVPDDNYEVAISLTQPRSLTIDYSQRKNSISVLLPVLFIWFLAASISIPLFVFGSVLPNEQAANICGIVNFNAENNLLMKLLVLILRIIIPIMCLLLTSVCVICKLYFSKSRIRPCGLEENVHKILKLTICISVTFVLFSMQRIYGSLLFEVLAIRPFMHYKYPEMGRVTGISLCALHYVLSAIRPFVYYVMDKNVRQQVGVTCCLRKKKIDGSRDKKNVL